MSVQLSTDEAAWTTVSITSRPKGADHHLRLREDRDNADRIANRLTSVAEEDWYGDRRG